ncbi:ATP-dependent RNA helicase DDX51 isoform X2 [Zootoca vivipara]|uniref:ATP-dependent RNA helicase DDX51 isoform X2 n=1 Tax=Zootoca vivipara TaxID=8524 RepID=UPI00158FCA1A|nr:ATP-dependent RNA helicase DDX51 isoform X2 [Zootoca vivipara]
MALFVVPRYLGDKDNDLEDHSQVLLRQLQERIRARQQQKQQQQQDDHMPAESGPDNEMPDLDLEKKAKQESRKRKQTEESPLIGGHRKRKKKLCTEGGEGMEEKDGDPSLRRSKTSGEESKTPQGRTDGGEGSEIKLDSHLENDSSAGERKDGLESRANESHGEEEETLKSPEDPKETPPPPNTIVIGDWGLKAAQKKKKVEPLLPRWLAEPKLVQRRIKENVVPLQDVPVIHPKLRKKLQANGIESLFPVQAEVIPAILESGFLAGRGGYQPSDICVSAPTGSGKTLAFVIPVVQALLDRVVCRVRALAVLPTKELAQQVNKVFNIYTDGTGLKVVQLTGQKSFAKEQESLAEETLTGFRSLADIVVATPGRLVDHLQQSPQFSLKELRFLIIDEADRMIDNMHQDWLRQVVAAAHSAVEEGFGTPQLFRRAEQGPLTAARAGCPHVPLQKLLFSATLTRNPEKLQPLGLYRPRLFTPISLEEKATETTKKYALPEGLSQYYVPCSLRWKPLFLLHFLLRLKFSRVLCFTNSRDTSHRLFLLLRAFGGVNVAEFSSRLNPRQRKLTLKEFEQGKIQLPAHHMV